MRNYLAKEILKKKKFVTYMWQTLLLRQTIDTAEPLASEIQ